MTDFCDLHTHSSASDGQYSPSELVTLAAENGIGVMALTDHDTTEGIAEASEAGGRCSVRVIPGVELSAREYNTYHILGYAYNTEAPELAALCARMKKRRDNRNRMILEYLNENGMPLEQGEIEAIAGGDIIGRPHIARAMVAHGYVKNNREAFDKWLDTDEIHERMDVGKPTARECVETIKASGGKASLAHPYQIGVDNDTLDAIVRELAGYGLDAIECLYPKFTPEQQAYYYHLAEKYGLHITGGSDFHGELVKPDVRLARLELDVDWLL
ncbi:MAG: PHP domain-containing protein [Oscillospiraceae bacterium]|nr:PHP domain-containing protein [Oscillospiraceae bacterium]